MESKTRTILVTWDFTIKSEYAFAHAVNISKIAQTDVTLVHVVKSEKENEELQKRLNDDVTNMHKKYGVRPKTLILKGSIFKTISNYASSNKNTELVIMGTHGIKGMQKVTGSFALKVIRGSKIPFLVVQDMPVGEAFNKIVFPIDFKKENKEKIKWVSYMCNLYHSKIYIVHPSVSDRISKNKIHSNIVFTRNYFENAGIRYEIAAIGKNSNIVAETIEFAKQKEANLILIMTSRIISFVDYLMGPSEQYFIANEEKIPVMVVNPKPRTMDSGFSATGN